MKVNRTVVRSVEFAGAMLLLFLGVVIAPAAVQIGTGQNEQPLIFEAVKTNWVQHVHTNVVEIQMPRVFVVNAYRTNTTVNIITNTVEISRTQWLDRFETNVTYVLRTNWTTRMQTNTVALDRYQTNVIDLVLTNVVIALATNWETRLLTNTLVLDQYRTNRIDTFKTNWVTRMQTNTLVVEQVRTNLHYAFYTNWTTLAFTNWQTVLVMKTNWVTQPVTNIVAINLPANSPPLVGLPSSIPVTAQNKGTKVENTVSPSPEDMKNLMFEWARIDGDKPEIVLTLKSAKNPGAPLHIQEWRVEKSDATVLLMGRQSEFRGELPPGTYNVTVKASRTENGPLMTLRGFITVTPDTNTHQVLVAAAGLRK